jgi:hypothetical protein
MSSYLKISGEAVVGRTKYNFEVISENLPEIKLDIEWDTKKISMNLNHFSALEDNFLFNQNILPSEFSMAISLEKHAGLTDKFIVIVFQEDVIHFHKGNEDTKKLSSGYDVKFSEKDLTAECFAKVFKEEFENFLGGKRNG